MARIRAATGGGEIQSAQHAERISPCGKRTAKEKISTVLSSTTTGRFCDPPAHGRGLFRRKALDQLMHVGTVAAEAKGESRVRTNGWIFVGQGVQQNRHGRFIAHRRQ